MAQLIYPEHEVPRKAIEGLSAGLGDRLVCVVLFGSRARGDHRAESDWDLLVIAEGLPQHLLDRRLHLVEALPLGICGSISMLAKTPGEFEAALPSIYLDIALDGQVLYDPRGYAAQKLAKLREILDRVGLYREHTSAGDIWRWRTPPAGRWAVEWDS